MPDTPPIAALKRDIATRFPGLVTGSCNCRPKTGNPNEWSQHAWCNALDIMTSSRATGDKVAAYVRSNGARLNVGNVIWWSPKHYDHVHVEGFPLKTGVPQCAGGVLTTVPFLGPIFGGAADAGISLANMIRGGGITTPLDAAVGGLALLTDKNTWLRVLWAVGGAATLGAGLLMLAKEMGAPVPSPKQVFNTAKTVATKGLA